MEIPKIDFHTWYVHFEFLVIFYGLTNAPTTFMDLMTMVFYQFLDLFVIVFIDEILLYSKSEVDHANHLCIMLKTLKDQ